MQNRCVVLKCTSGKYNPQPLFRFPLDAERYLNIDANSVAKAEGSSKDTGVTFIILLFLGCFDFRKNMKRHMFY